MVFEIIFVTVMFLISIYNLTIAIMGLFPRCRATAVGTLVKSNTRRNVQTGNRYVKRISVLTRYTYSYIVNGKQYSYSAEVYYSKRRLFQKVTMVYVKGFPRYAYPNKFNGSTQWTMGLFTLILGMLIVAAMIFA